ncbi:MAG: choice-of-anchor D domain-containing protein, partial [Bacteroidota bacterium]
MKNLYGFQRLAVVIVCTMLFTGGLRAANTMHMGSASMGPVQPITLRVSIDNSNAFVAFQFDLPIPAGFSYVGNSAALNPSRTSGQVLQAQLISGNILRVLGYSPNNIPFTGDTGTIMTFQLRSGTVPGEFPLSLQAPIIGDVNQVNILTGSFNGTATVLAPDINITVTSIDFDRTPLGQSTTRTLQIDNTGNQPLNILSITFNSSYFEVAGSSAFSISGGQTAYVTIRFNSIVKGYYNQVLTIVSNDPDETAIPVALQSHAFAVNELHTGSLSVFSGKQGTLSFSVNNMEGFTGFQFDLQLPSPMTYITGSATLSGRNTDHIISANMIPGNKLRIIAYSPTMQLFSGTDGNILNLNFMVVGAGGYYPLNIINVVIGSTTGENCLSDFYNGSLQIAAPDILCSNSLSFGDVSVLATGHQNF